MARAKGTLVTAAQIAEYSNPLIRKPTFNIQAFADARIVAGLFRYFSQHGFSEPKFSALVNLALETLHDVLVRQGKIQPEESPHIAIAELEAAGFSMAQLKDHRRGRRLIRHLAAENTAEGWGTELDAVCQSNMPKRSTPIAPISTVGEKEAITQAVKYMLSNGEEFPIAIWKRIFALEKQGVWFDCLVGVERPSEAVQNSPEWLEETACTPSPSPEEAQAREAEREKVKAQLQAMVEANAWLETATPLQEFCEQPDCFQQLLATEDGSVRCRRGHSAAVKEDGSFGTSFEAMQAKLKGTKGGDS